MTIARIDRVRVVVKNLHPVRDHRARADAYKLPRRNDHVVPD